MDFEYIYFVIDDLDVYKLEEFFSYWFGMDIRKEIKGNGEYFPYLYYPFQFPDTDQWIYDLLVETFCDKWNYKVCKREVTNKGWGGMNNMTLTQDAFIIYPSSFKKHLDNNKDKFLEDIFKMYV